MLILFKYSSNPRYLVKTGTIIFCFLLNFRLLNAQYITLSGYVKDNETGENLIGATIYAVNNSKGTVTNNYGFFSMRTQKESLVAFSYVGYSVYTLGPVTHDTMVTIRLQPNLVLGEVKVFGTRNSFAYIGSEKIFMKEVKSLPVIAGETDLLKSIQLLPGIQGGIEGTSGFHVRGSSPDQNLILIDGVPVYNVNHLFGVFSVFNTDAINNAEIYKSIFPARYGGRIASVLDISMKEGNSEKFHGNAGIGLISSKILLEGPIKRIKTTYLLTARRTYFDLFTVPLLWIINNKETTGGYYFHDLNAKINHTFNDRNRLFLSIYGGKDKFYLRENRQYTDLTGAEHSNNSRNNLGWGNLIAQLCWNHIISPKLFFNLSAVYSQYKFNTYKYYDYLVQTDSTSEKSAFEQELSSVVKDLSVSANFDYFIANSLKFRSGLNITQHNFSPGVDMELAADPEHGMSVDTSYHNPDYLAIEFNTYAEVEFSLGLLKSNIGTRYTNYRIEGKGFDVFEPRFLLDLKLIKQLSFKAGYSQNYQLAHLLSSPGLGFPTDQWVPVTRQIRPAFARQVSTGLEYRHRIFNVSAELFYKEMENLLEFKEGNSMQNWEEKVTQGTGKAYGAELYIGKETGKTTGWIAYTLSKSDRTFDEINFGRTFPYKYDRRHDLKIVLNQKLGNHLDIGAVWVYMTGYAYTLEMESYMTAKDCFRTPLFFTNRLPNYARYYEHRNNMRMPPYQRLDINLNYCWEKKKKTRQLSLGAYNVYNRKNPVSASYWGGQLHYTSILPILPYIHYSFDF